MYTHIHIRHPCKVVNLLLKILATVLKTITQLTRIQIQSHFNDTSSSGVAHFKLYRLGRPFFFCSFFFWTQFRLSSVRLRQKLLVFYLQRGSARWVYGEVWNLARFFFFCSLFLTAHSLDGFRSDLRCRAVAMYRWCPVAVSTQQLGGLGACSPRKIN